MSRYTCNDCGETYHKHDNHEEWCPGPSLRRAEVADMIREALAEERAGIAEGIMAIAQASENDDVHFVLKAIAGLLASDEEPEGDR